MKRDGKSDVVALAVFLSLSMTVIPTAANQWTSVGTTHVPSIVIPPAVTSQFMHPVPKPWQISSTFGPRWKSSSSRWDYHGGIDMYDERDTPIVSIGDGVVYDLPYYTSGGRSVVILHTLASPISFHGQSITKLYSVYMHLDSRAAGLSEGDNVTRGQVIGLMGDSGQTTFVHLHFETRLGTLCSLPYQMSNPSSSCSTGYEPKVHPFLFLPSVSSTNTTLPLMPDGGSISVSSHQRTITFLVTNRANLALNRIYWKEVVLDFSLYTGFNASDLDVLDELAFPWGRLSPGLFLSSTTDYNMTVVMNQPLEHSITFVDVWGNAITAEMPHSSAEVVIGIVCAVLVVVAAIGVFRYLSKRGESKRRFVQQDGEDFFSMDMAPREQDI